MGLLDLQMYAPQVGLLNEDQRKQAAMNGWFNTAANLFDASAPQAGGVGKTPLQMLGTGMKGFTQGTQDYTQSAVASNMLEKKLKEEQDRKDWAAKVAPQLGQYGLPESVAQGMPEDEIVKIIVDAIKAKNSPSGGAPATIQIANEMQKALREGDTERFNLLNQVHKTMDRGVTFDQSTMRPVAMDGYAQAVGGIGAVKKGMEQQAQKNVDLYMNPQIAGGEAAARYEQELANAPKIKEATDLAAGSAKIQTEYGKKANSAVNQNVILDEAQKLLPKATGSGVGAIASAAKGFAGYSDASTQANKQLKTLSGWLVSNVPRMEGPQSDYDVANYKQMAADIGNESVPVKDRLAAIETLKGMNSKYSSKPSNQPDSAGIRLDAPSATEYDYDPVSKKLVPRGN